MKKLKKRIPSGSLLNSRKFSLVLIVATSFAIASTVYLAILGPKNDPTGWSLLLMTFGQFFLLYSFIFLLNYLAKSISLVEHQKIVDFSQYAGYFFCLFFFPIGIWWIHPKIEKLLLQNDT